MTRDNGHQSVGPKKTKTAFYGAPEHGRHATGAKGLSQGGVLSPLLSNLSLNEVDRMLERAREATRHGSHTYVEYARYAEPSFGPRPSGSPGAAEKSSGLLAPRAWLDQQFQQLHDLGVIDPSRHFSSSR